MSSSNEAPFFPNATTGTWTFATLPNTGHVSGDQLYTSDQGLCGWDGQFWFPVFNSVAVKMTGYTIGSADNVVAHAGGGQALATPIQTQMTRVTTVATPADSVRLGPSVVGVVVWLVNGSANAMQVFGFGTDTINGVATATGVSQAGNSVGMYVCTTAGNWSK